MGPWILPPAQPQLSTIYFTEEHFSKALQDWKTEHSAELLMLTRPCCV